MKKQCNQTKGNNGLRSCNSSSSSKSTRGSNAYDLNRVGGHSSKRNGGSNPYDLNNAGFKR